MSPVGGPERLCLPQWSLLVLHYPRFHQLRVIPTEIVKKEKFALDGAAVYEICSLELKLWEIIVVWIGNYLKVFLFKSPIASRLSQ